jgi:hypothetical protein
MRTKVWAALRDEAYVAPEVVSLHHSKDGAKAAVAAHAVKEGGEIEEWQYESATYAEVWSRSDRYMVKEWEIKP